LSKICLCLTGKTLKRDLELVEKYRKYADIAELRVDCLDPDERFLIRGFPEAAGLPVILAIRRVMDGGRFEGGEGQRINLFSRGLAFADADRRRNFAYVDLEADLDVPSLEEAVRAFGTRIIRSYHNMHGVDADLAGRIRSLLHAGDEIVKIAVMPHSASDVLRVLRAAKETSGLEKILLCMGALGTPTRILAEKFGSQMSYAYVSGEPDIPIAAPGQLDVKELFELYRFKSITAQTKIYGIVGYPLKITGSPAFFNKVFNLENTDAVYVPFPSESLPSFMELAGELDLLGVSVTVPYKEQVLQFLSQKSAEVDSAGACNTITRFNKQWRGTNTDIKGFSDSLLAFTGKKNLKHLKVTIIGAGGAARAVASEAHRLGARCLILNRTALRARDLAGRYKFRWGALDIHGVQMMDKYSDIVIQSTSAGTEGNPCRDPLELYTFTGREIVMDLVYKPEATPFLKRAASAGCRTLNGYDMLMRQAQYQYVQFMGRDFPVKLLSRINFG
jgi:3-dehydroquinate dehydratase/shikimate dehydrogenase